MLVKTQSFTYDPGQPYIPPSPGGVQCHPASPPVHPPVTPFPPAIPLPYPVGAAPNNGLTLGTGYGSNGLRFDNGRGGSGGSTKCFDGYEWDARDRVCRPAKPKHPAPPPRDDGGETCIYVPPSEGQPYIPPRFIPKEGSGDEWDAGANSVDILDGDLLLRFVMPTVGGVVCGLTNNRIETSNPNRIHYGFCFFDDTTFAVVERGEELTPRRTYTPMSTEFKAIRVEGVVTYYVDNMHVLTSRVQSVGRLSVGAALFSVGDSIP